MPGRDLAALISPEYLVEQQRLHRSGDYGRAGDKWASVIAEVIRSTGSEDVLDYGCGKGALARHLTELGFDVAEYDPAIADKRELPEPADLVVACDVLEHVEPNRLWAVIEHLSDLTKIALFAAISTRPAGKRLSDGRNAHLLIENETWWRHQFERHGFRVKRTWESTQEWVAMLRPPNI